MTAQIKTVAFKNETIGISIGLVNDRAYTPEFDPSTGARTGPTYYEIIDKNKTRIIDTIDTLKGYKVDMIIFPEFSLTGYFWGKEPDGDPNCWNYMMAGVLDLQIDFLEKIKSKLDTKLKYVIFNSIRLDPNRTGEKSRFLNSTYVIDNRFDCKNIAQNEGTHIYDKTFLPGIEKIYTLSPKNPKTAFLVIDTDKGGKFGFTTCYDMCFAQLYQEYALVHKVDAIIQLASWRATGENEGKRTYELVCSPPVHDCTVREDNYWRFQWNTMISDRAATNQIWMIGANAVGVQETGNYTFCGDSGVWAPSGITICKASSQEKELLIVRNIPIKEKRKEEYEEFNLETDFRLVYEPISGTPSCSRASCSSFTRWGK